MLKVFLFPFGEGGDGIFFWFFVVPIKFSRGSPQVPNAPNSSAFLSHIIGPKLSSFHLHRWVAKGEALHFRSKVSVFFSFFGVAGQSKSLNTEKRKVELGKHLI
jgi:hypothetical protein